MKKHLAIMNKPAIEAILGGTKTIETRFSKRKTVPFGAVGAGDLVYMKSPRGEVVGQFKVKKVFSYEGLTEADLEKIFAEYGSQISVGEKTEDEKYYREKKDSLFGTVIFISESERFITSPIKTQKSGVGGWIVLE